MVKLCILSVKDSKSLKTIPCSAALTRLGQITECTRPPREQLQEYICIQCFVYGYDSYCYFFLAKNPDSNQLQQALMAALFP